VRVPTSARTVLPPHCASRAPIRPQVGFIKFLVQPLYTGLAEFLPELKMTALMHLDANLNHFSAQTQQRQQQGASA
jgi:hypothetical protein